MGTMSKLQLRTLVVLTVALIVSIVLAVFAYEITLATWPGAQRLAQVQSATPPVMSIPTAGTRPISPLTPTPSSNLVVDPSTVRGIDSGPPSMYPGIFWIRLSYT